MHMNGIDRQLGVVSKHLKHIKLTFTFISLIILLAVSSIALVANAQEEIETATTTEAAATNTADVNEEEVRIIEEEVTTGSNKQNINAALNTRAQERIRNLAANMSNRMDAAIIRLEKISARIETRLEIISNENPEIDLLSATAHLEIARNNLDTAKTIMSDIDMQVNQTVGSESPQSAWQEAKSSFKMTKNYITLAHSSLKDSVTATRQALTGENTTTQEVSEIEE